MNNGVRTRFRIKILLNRIGRPIIGTHIIVTRNIVLQTDCTYLLINQKNIRSGLRTKIPSTVEKTNHLLILSPLIVHRLIL